MDDREQREIEDRRNFLKSAGRFARGDTPSYYAVVVNVADIGCDRAFGCEKRQQG